MKNPNISIGISVETILVLNEAETRALDGIFGYNVDAFLKVFYEKMGRAYVQPYEAGVRSLHEKIRKVTSPAIAQIDTTRTALHRLQHPIS